MYIVMWHGESDGPPTLAFRYALVDAQKVFDDWSDDCPDGDTVSLHRIDPSTECMFELQTASGDLPF